MTYLAGCAAFLSQFAAGDGGQDVAEEIGDLVAGGGEVFVEDKNAGISAICP